MDEPRYTLDQARTELARRACTNEGHDYEVIGTRAPTHPAGTPLEVICDRCDTHWPVGAGTSTRVTIDVSAGDRELIRRVRSMIRSHKDSAGRGEPATPPEETR